MKTQDKLLALREYMRKNNIDIYLIPSTDGHNSEYVPECWQRRSWISNFTGSAGEALVTLKHAYLWTDGRYFLQAEHELDLNHYQLMRQTGFVSELEAWLIENARNKTLGVDPSLVSIDRANNLHKIMSDISGKLVFTEDNLVDLCRLKNNENLSLPENSAFKLEDKYNGMSTQTKLSLIQNELEKHQADYLVLNVLDEIAWAFNLRGEDIAYNPLAISYAIIGKNESQLFIAKNKISDSLQAEFAKLNIQICNYNEFKTTLNKLMGSVWLDSKTANYWIYNNLNNDQEIILATSPIVLPKACKNNTEQEGTRFAHIKDAGAVIGFLAWLSKNWQHGVDEISSQNKLHEFRAKQDNFKQESFATISGFAENGAVIHYKSTDTTKKVIDNSSIYLLDSGGQYLEGTTDITRTVHLGTATPQQKQHYTLVLKGHLALARLKFPENTNGEHIDAFARHYLWQYGLDYRHGTGHGVGSFLCVHEGPQKISKALSRTPLQAGMIVSNEPGYYADGKYGIRIENLCLVVKDDVSEYGQFYKFENLTLVPYCKNLLDFGLLDTTEIAQIKDYYTQIKLKVRDRLNKDEQIWLDNELNI